MSRVFRITPKRTKRANGTVLTPDMVITVTTRQHTTDPFYIGAVETQVQYSRECTNSTTRLAKQFPNLIFS